MRQLTMSKKQSPTLLSKYWKYKALLILLIPGLIYYIIFNYGPMYGAQIAFRDFNFKLGLTGSPWVGWQNFKDVFSLGSFWEVFGNTLIISTYKLIFGFPVPIIFALLLSELRGPIFKKSVQTLSYLPHFVSWVVLGSIFTQLLSPITGPINILLKSMGIEPIFFLGDTRYFRFTLVVTSIWKGVGWGSIVYLAAISGVDVSLYEAAELDGAGRFQKVHHITLPSIMPIITIMLIFAVGNIVNDDFDQIFNLYNSAVYSVGDVLGTYTYRMGLVGTQYSFAASVGLFTNAISFVLIILANVVSKRFGEYGIW